MLLTNILVVLEPSTYARGVRTPNAPPTFETNPGETITHRHTHTQTHRHTHYHLAGVSHSYIRHKCIYMLTLPKPALVPTLQPSIYNLLATTTPPFPSIHRTLTRTHALRLHHIFAGPGPEGETLSVHELEGRHNRLQLRLHLLPPSVVAPRQQRVELPVLHRHRCQTVTQVLRRLGHKFKLVVLLVVFLNFLRGQHLRGLTGRFQNLREGAGRGIDREAGGGSF